MSRLWIVFAAFKRVRSLLRMSSDSLFLITVDYLDWMGNKLWWMMYDFDDIIIGWTD